MGVSNVLNSSLELRSKPKGGIRKKLTPVKPSLKRKALKVQFTNTDDVVEYECTKQPRENLWWTKDERKEILQANQRLAKQFKLTHPQEIACANEAYDQCCYDNDTCSSSSSCSSESEDENSTSWLSRRPKKRPKLHLPTHVRGLEWAILPYSKKHRKVHVQQVVQAQDEDDMAELAESSSKACVAFARLLAQCDSASAAPGFVKRPRPRMWW